MKEDNHAIIFHELPRIGQICVPFYGQAKVFFEALESDGMIEYMRKVKQLGFIYEVFPSQSHSRLDYCMLQFHLMNMLSNTFPNLSLTSKLKLTNTTTITTSEFLQIWTFISNIGNFTDITPSAKALTNLFNKTNKWKEILSPEILKYSYTIGLCKDIFEQNNFYKLKYILAFDYFLKVTKTRELTIAIINFMSNLTEVGAEKLEIHNRVRRISYIYFDSINSIFPITFDIIKIVMNVSNYPILFDPKSREYDRLIEHCEAALMRKIYISENAMPRFFQIYKSRVAMMPNFVNTLKTNEPVLNAIKKHRAFASSPGPLKKGIIPLQLYINLDEAVLFGQADNLLNNQFYISISSYENKLKSIINEEIKKHFEVAILFDQARKYIFLNFVINKNKITTENIGEYLCTYFRIVEEFKLILKAHLNVDPFKDIFYKILFHDYNRKAILNSLKLFIRNASHLNIHLLKRKHMQSPSESINAKFVIVDKVQSVSKIKNRVIAAINEKAKFLPSEVNTVNCLLHYLKNEHSVSSKANFYYAMSPIKIFGSIESVAALKSSKNPYEYKDITDIDAIIVSFNKRVFKFTLFEGKDLKKGFKREVNSFFDKFREIGFLDEESASFNFIDETFPKAKGGYITIKHRFKAI